MVFLATLAEGGFFTALMSALAVLCTFIFAYTFVTVHEYGHALTAQYLGYKTRDISLYPMAGLASISGDWHKNPKHEFLITIFGPLTNVAMAGLAWLYLQLCTPETIEYVLLNFAFKINVTLVIFNIIPVYPMDGGRLLRAGIGYFSNNWWTGTVWATRSAFVCGLAAIPVGFYLEQPIAGFMVAFMGLIVAQGEMVGLKNLKEIEDLENERFNLFENMMRTESERLWPDDEKKRKLFMDSMISFHKFLLRFVHWAVNKGMPVSSFEKILQYLFESCQDEKRRLELNTKAAMDEEAVFQEIADEVLNENRPIDGDAQSSAA